MERNKFAEFLTAVAIIALIAVAIGYPIFEGHSTAKEKGGAEIIITTDFGSNLVLEKRISSGKSVMESLKSVASVRTAYGGKFVVAIDNISSNMQKSEDWFYYVNGILSNVGASEYVIHKGDVIRWDYHYWGNNMPVSAEIMDFPSMLTNGYDGKVFPTVVAYEYNYKAEANNILKFLHKQNITATKLEISMLNNSMKRTDNLILIGTDDPVLNYLFSSYKNLGLKYRISGSSVVDWNGNKSSGAFAEAVQSPFNPKGTMACENVVIIISGNENIGNIVTKLQSPDSFWLYSGESNE